MLKSLYKKYGLRSFNNFARSFLGKIIFFAVLRPAAEGGPEGWRKTGRQKSI